MKALVWVLSLLLLVGQAGMARGEGMPPDLATYNELRVLIENFKSFVVERIGEPEASIIRDVHVRVDPRGWTNAVAYRNTKSGAREIAIYTGLYGMYKN